MRNDVQALLGTIDGLRVLTDDDSLARYGADWTRFHTPDPSAVVLPDRLDQIQDLVRLAREHGLSLVPSGGRTGLSGGAVAARGEIVVSMDRFNAIEDFDPVDRTVRVGAGVVTQTLQEFAEAQGLYFPVDFASKGSSQIGGNLATNAGGIRVLRYGLMRDWVMGLTVVTGRGDVLELNRGLIKNASGYDLRHLFVGSEGTLGVIVDAVIRLAAPPPPQSVMVMAVPAIEAVMSVFAEARGRLTLSAFEFFSDLALDRVLARHALRCPFEERAQWYALLECDRDEDGALAVFEACLERGLAVDGVISQSDAQARDLWALRENISESISPETPYKNDISVRVSRVPEFLSALDEIVAREYPGFEVLWYGHIGDGNLHLNILKPADMETDAFARTCESVNGHVFGLVERLQGSVSAEHGVGLLKKPYLKHTRSEAEIGYLRDLRRVFDPDGVLNPGKLLD